MSICARIIISVALQQVDHAPDAKTGFYSLMLTSLLLGLIVMVLYKPRTWCAFCPMGTMTQSICKLKNKD